MKTLPDLAILRSASTSATLLPRAVEARGPIRSHSTGTDDGDWDGPAAVSKCPADEEHLYKLSAWVDSGKDADAKSSYKFPHHFVDDESIGDASTKACSAGIAVLNGGRGGADIPEADRQGVYAHLARHLRDAGQDPPELNSADPDGARTADGTLLGEVMVTRFSAFGAWYEINSWWEGRFLERVMPGSFKRTIANNGDRLRVLFDHGMDFQINDKILGRPEILEERADGAYAEVPLLDTSYCRDLVPGLRVGGYGSSFMFHVLDERWVEEPERSEHNPNGLPERSIYEVRLMEAGPVTWPASPAATAGLRSGSDWFCDRLRARGDSTRFDALATRFSYFRALHGLRTFDGEPACGGTLPDESADTSLDAPAPGHAIGAALAHQRQRYLMMQREGVLL